MIVACLFDITVGRRLLKVIIAKKGPVNGHVRKLVYSDRSDTGHGHQADCTKKDIFLGEGPVLAVDVSLILPLKSRTGFLPMDRPEKHSAAFMQGKIISRRVSRDLQPHTELSTRHLGQPSARLWLYLRPNSRPGHKCLHRPV